jgi:hypothetical protein
MGCSSWIHRHIFTNTHAVFTLHAAIDLNYLVYTPYTDPTTHEQLRLTQSVLRIVRDSGCIIDIVSKSEYERVAVQTQISIEATPFSVVHTVV